MKINYFETAVKHHKDGNWNKAKEIYEHILKKNPENFIVLQNYGSLLAKLREYKQAKNIFEKCLKIKPNDFLVLYNLGKFYQEMKIFDKAVSYYEKSYSIEPKKNLSMYNIGNIYLFQKKFDLAINAYQKSIKVNPENFLAHNNLAISYKNIGNFKKSLESYKNSLKKNNSSPDVHINYSTQLLMFENFKEGFEEYEWRKKSKLFLDYINYSKLKLNSKLWSGENLDNKTILIIAEQGIGDLIQFSRYLYLIKEKYNAKVIIYLKSKKFSHFFNKNEFNIIAEGEPIPKHDYHNHLLSLLKIFFKENNLFYKPINFFQTNRDLQKKWSEKLKKYKGIKIGINSSTSLTKKDIPLKYFIQLALDLNFNFFIIQKEIGNNDLKKISNKKNILYFPEIDTSNNAFDDSIEIIRNLDLIISADTAVAHLSATIGKKTLIPLPLVSDWRWFIDKSNSKWYENVTLYRQKKRDDWEEQFKLIKKDLIKLFNS